MAVLFQIVLYNDWYYFRWFCIMNGIISDYSLVKVFHLGNLQQYLWLEFRIVDILVIFLKIPSYHHHHQDTFRVKSRDPTDLKIYFQLWLKTTLFIPL